jgi:hypothetical protein
MNQTAQTKPSSPQQHPFDIESLLAAISERAESSDWGLIDEIRDLEGLLDEAWEGMSSQQKTAFLSSPDIASTYEAAAGKEWRYTSSQNEGASQKLFNLLKSAADEHGEDEPDHQVGDLQEYLRAAWATIGVERQRELAVGQTMDDVMDYLDRNLLTDIDEADAGEWEAAVAHFGLEASHPWTSEQQLNYCNALRIVSVAPDQERHTVEPRRRESRDNAQSRDSMPRER